MSDNHQDPILALTVAFEKYCTKMDVIIERMDKVQAQHSNEIWGTDDNNLGLKAKIKVLIDSRSDEKAERLWWRTLIGLPLVGLIFDWFAKYFHRSSPLP